MQVIERLSFDAHGKRRHANGYGDMSNLLTSQITTRGFTDHEHLDGVDLIHMNGRVYDPHLGRFLTADPTVQYPDSTQGLNRYSYVENNPLSFTDPSGFGFFSDIARGIRGLFRALRKNFRTLVAIGIAFIPGINAFAAGFIGGVISGGDLKSGIIGALTAGAFQGIGSLVKAGTLNRLGSIIAHGAVGGVSSVAQGGKFGSGFLAGGFSAAAGPYAGKLGAKFGDVAGTLASAVAGGVGSVLGGGKFANGAVTGAFTYLATRGAQAIKEARQAERVYVTGHRVGKVGPMHLALEFTGGSGPHVISAGPEDGLLVSGQDTQRPGDKPELNVTVGQVTPPGGTSPGSYFARLQEADLRYCDCLDYDLFPGMMDSYNSNSYDHGLIGATGGSSSVNFDNYYGGPKPVPSEYFR